MAFIIKGLWILLVCGERGFSSRRQAEAQAAWWSCHEERPKRNLFVFSVIIVRNELLFFFPMILVLLSNKSVYEVVSPLPDRNLLINLFFNQKIDSPPQNNYLLISRKTSKVLDSIQHRIRAFWNLRDFSEKTISIWRGILAKQVSWLGMVWSLWEGWSWGRGEGHKKKGSVS